MARWRRATGSGIPEELARFVRSEWPGGCVHEAGWQWAQACAEWLAADSGHEPRPGLDERSQRWWLAGASRRSLPFGEFGDAIDVLRAARAYRQDCRCGG